MTDNNSELASQAVSILKKNNLFGLNLTRKEIDKEQRAIIVEGYMDMISLYQNGIRNVAASLGTALTLNQARLLCRYSRNIVLSYDSDSAGINAALRGIDVITAAGGKPRVMNVTDGKDPDDFVRAHGKEAYLKLADNAMPATAVGRAKGRSISPIEQFLLDKFNAEIGYCNIALFKAGIGAVEELKGLVEIGKKHIEKYENEYRSTACTERVCL